MNHVILAIPTEPVAAAAALNAATGFVFAGWLHPPQSVGTNYAILVAVSPT